MSFIVFVVVKKYLTTKAQKQKSVKKYLTTENTKEKLLTANHTNLREFVYNIIIFKDKYFYSVYPCSSVVRNFFPFSSWFNNFLCVFAINTIFNAKIQIFDQFAHFLFPYLFLRIFIQIQNVF